MGDDGVALVELAGVSKSYGGVRAVRSVDFTVWAGEVHALLGENGAGKPTLMKVLSGEVAAEEGAIRIGGEPVRFARPADAQRAGIAMIHQELDLVPALSVAENVFLGREPQRRTGCWTASTWSGEHESSSNGPVWTSTPPHPPSDCVPANNNWCPSPKRCP